MSKRIIKLVGLILLPFFMINGKNNKSSYPNIILVMSDDQGLGDVGYYDHPHLCTPNLDSMATKGLQFNRFYAAVGGGPDLKAGKKQQGITGGFRGRKGTLYEGGIRVPGIIEWPVVITKHRETDFPAVSSDYLPTIFDILELHSAILNAMLDGISLYDLINQEAESKRIKPTGFQSPFQGEMFQAWIDNHFKLVWCHR